MERKSPETQLTEHVVICNCNEKVKTIVKELQTGSTSIPLDVVLIVQSKTLWEANPDWHPESYPDAYFGVVFGTPFDEPTLNQAFIKTARAAIILADPLHGQLADAQSTLAAVAIEKRNPSVHTIQELILSVNRSHLEAMCVDEIVCIGEISEKLIAQSCITPGVKNIFESLLTTESGTPQIFLSELSDSFSGLSFRNISKKCILNQAPFTIIGFSVDIPELGTFVINRNTISRSFVVNPNKAGKNMPLKAGDKLITIAYEEPDLQQFLK